jgi:hypothetical protein
LKHLFDKYSKKISHTAHAARKTGPQELIFVPPHGKNMHYYALNDCQELLSLLQLLQ